MIASNGKLISDHNDFLAIQTIYDDLLLNNKNWTDLSSNDLTALYGYRDSNVNLAASQAQHIINFYYNERHVTIPALPPGSSAIQSSPPSVREGSQTSKHRSTTGEMTADLLAFPNPARNQVEFRYSKVENNVQPAYLEVFDITGRLLFQHDVSSNEGSIFLAIPDGLQGLVTYSIRKGESRVLPQKLVILPK